MESAIILLLKFVGVLLTAIVLLFVLDRFTKNKEKKKEGQTTSTPLVSLVKETGKTGLTKLKSSGKGLKGLPYGKILVGGAIAILVFFPTEFETWGGRSVSAVKNVLGTSWSGLLRHDSVVMVDPAHGALRVEVPHGAWTSSYKAPKGLSLHYIGDNQYTGTFREECQEEYWNMGAKKCSRLRLFGTDKKGRITPVYLVAK